MRVITGAARGRKLLEPAGCDIRPTTDMVKEALFNIIQFEVEGRHALDLFAGTGQLGLEALSRGAASCVFTDNSRAAVALVKENLKRCGFSGQVIQCDSLAYLRSNGPFDLIFIDPPFDSGLDAKAVELVIAFDKLSKGGIMICETARDRFLPEIPAEWGNVHTYTYGKVQLTAITRKAE